MLTPNERCFRDTYHNIEEVRDVTVITALRLMEAAVLARGTVCTPGGRQGGDRMTRLHTTDGLRFIGEVFNELDYYLLKMRGQRPDLARDSPDDPLFTRISGRGLLFTSRERVMSRIVDDEPSNPDDAGLPSLVAAFEASMGYLSDNDALQPELPEFYHGPGIDAAMCCLADVAAERGV